MHVRYGVGILVTLMRTPCYDAADHSPRIQHTHMKDFIADTLVVLEQEIVVLFYVIDTCRLGGARNPSGRHMDIKGFLLDAVFGTSISWSWKKHLRHTFKVTVSRKEAVDH